MALTEGPEEELDRKPGKTKYRSKPRKPTPLPNARPTLTPNHSCPNRFHLSLRVSWNCLPWGSGYGPAWSVLRCVSTISTQLCVGSGCNTAGHTPTACTRKCCKSSRTAQTGLGEARTRGSQVRTLCEARMRTQNVYNVYQKWGDATWHQDVPTSGGTCV